MDKITNIPEIRFDGFTDAWEQRRLGEVVDIRSGRDYKHLNKGNIPVYGTGGYMLSVDEALSYEDDAIGVGRKGTIDKPYLLKAPFWTVDTLFFSIPKTDYDLYFVNDIFQRINWKQLDESTGVPSLSKTAINAVKVQVPTFEEQIKIGNFFKHLDHLITLHQRKLELLYETKQTFLSQMFPKGEESVPEIRFEGYADAWEQRRLGDTVVIFAGGDIDKSKLKKVGKYPVLANALTNDGIVGYYDSDFRIEAPAVTVTGRGDVGYAKARKVNFTPVVRLLAIKSDNDVDFLENAINNHKVLVESTGVPQLTSPQLANYKILFPTIGEQTQIGTFFAAIDHLTTLHQRKLNTLKEIKKTLLKKMFV
ncbi:type I restriction enzyme, S subunit [Pilibacter termitis]|uniref:Type I restriction enzyme, S subunit n=1 Tax=Pilibacter termitis TaxID=263852 RepID=A0A1T4MG54_9ENTE|nr:restriction endonuclease subunit S [Pilibacter termitis]SJZ65827.1 type I restriction enzyme, S subunit [Pilibacter termitis]